MNMLRETCRCGHDKDTHFEKEATCLGVNYDCPCYRDADAPETPRMLAPAAHVKAPKTVDWFGRRIVKRKPHAKPDCYCSKCLDWHVAMRP